MANVKRLFYAEDEFTHITVYQNSQNKLYLAINTDDDSAFISSIALDISTAVALSKEIRREIAKMKEDE